MRTDLFDFQLPASSIALRPASPRDSARMLVVHPDSGLRDRVVTDLPLWLEPGDQLVVNDTKVISAQLKGRRIGRDTLIGIGARLLSGCEIGDECLIAAGAVVTEGRRIPAHSVVIAMRPSIGWAV